MDGEVAIQPEGAEQPFIYRGFQMVDEEKLRDLRGDELRKMNQNGMLPLIFAHLFSLSLIRDIFARQVQQGKGPIAAPQPARPPKRERLARRSANVTIRNGAGRTHHRGHVAPLSLLPLQRSARAAHHQVRSSLNFGHPGIAGVALFIRRPRQKRRSSSDWPSRMASASNSRATFGRSPARASRRRRAR